MTAAIGDDTPTLPLALRKRLTDLLGWPGGCLLSERDRWPLWLPVLLGLGVAGYFWSAVEPPLWVGGATALLLLALAIRGRQHGVGLALLALFTVAIGLTAAQVRTAMIAAPVLERSWGPAGLTAEVLASEPRESGWRLYLRPLEMPGLTQDALPAKLRVTVTALIKCPESSNFCSAPC